MATPALTLECTAGSSANKEKPWKFPLAERWGPIPMHCMQSNSLFTITQVRRIDLLDGTKESPPEVRNKSRRTLMSPQECQIASCSIYQIEMTTNSPALASEQCPIPHHTGQLAWLPLSNTKHSLRHPSQVYRNTNFSTGTRGKLHAPHIVSKREVIPRILLNR